MKERYIASALALLTVTMLALAPMDMDQPSGAPSTGDMTGGEGGATASLPEIDWARQIGTADNDHPSVNEEADVAIDPTGLYVHGYTYGSLPGYMNNGYSDLFVVKYDREGNLLWSTQFGSDKRDFSAGIVAYDGYVYLTGTTQGDLLGEGTHVYRPQGYLIKMDQEGNVIWGTLFGTLNSEEVLGIDVDSSGVYIAGTWIQDSTYNMMVYCFDLEGDPVWDVGFLSTTNDHGMSIAVDTEALYIGGYTSGNMLDQTSSGGDDPFLMKMDKMGNVLWTRQVGTSGYDYARAVTTDGTSVYITGWTHGAFPGYPVPSHTYMFVQKYDIDGNLIWTREGFVPDSYTSGYDIHLQGSRVYITGWAKPYDVIIWRYDMNGNEVWMYNIENPGFDRGYGINGDSTGIYVTGIASYGFLGQTGLGGWDLFLMKLLDDAPEIMVAPGSVEMGDVILWQTEVAIVTVSNVGTSDLTVNDIYLDMMASWDFYILSAPATPLTLAPGATVDVVLGFKTFTEGVHSNTLSIESDDPDTTTTEVPLTATGVLCDEPPCCWIAQILAFYDLSVDMGDLEGDGPGNSAGGRLKALRNMIKAAGDLIEDGDIEGAIEQLQDAADRTDGKTPPPDFVKGDAMEELMLRIQWLIDYLGTLM